MSDRLSAIRERLERITPGTWERGGPYPSVSVIYCVDGGCGVSHPDGPEPPVYEPVAMLHQAGPDFSLPPPEQAVSDAEFIASAPADIRWLLSIAEAAAAYREAETAWDVGPSDVTYRAMDDAESSLFAALDGKGEGNGTHCS